MTLSRRETSGRQTEAPKVAAPCGGPAIFTFGTGMFLLPLHPSLPFCPHAAPRGPQHCLFSCREVPAELRRLAHGGQVNLDMEDHRDEDFVKPKGTFKAFTGEGQKLGR